MRAHFCWMLTLLAFSADAAAQGHQYYEQYRANGQVTGSCEGIVEFTNQLRQVLVGEWKHQSTLRYPSKGITRYRIFLETVEREAFSICRTTASFQDSISFSNPDAFGGIRGEANFKTDIGNTELAYQPRPGVNNTCLPARPPFDAVPSGTYSMSLSLPIEESAGQCTLRMPKLRLTNGTSSVEYTVRLIDADTFAVFGHQMDRIFQRVRSKAQ